MAKLQLLRFAMAEAGEGPSGPPPKKLKKSTSLSKVTAEGRVRQFSDDFYADSGTLFCKFCDHSVDFVRVDTIKDHLKSKKHLSKKESSKSNSKSTRQVSLTTIVKAKDQREEFIFDFIKVCTLADIPLEKTEKMRPFLQKYCKQSGALPGDKALRRMYVPRLFEQHLDALKSLLANSTVSIVADETTDIRDHSILNIIALVKDKSYLIDVVTLEACNNVTFSQGIIKAVTDMGISYNNIIAVVSDSAAYTIKAYRDVLSVIFPKSIHVRCMAHIVNLVSEIFHHHSTFKFTADLVSMMKSVFYKKPARKGRFIKFLEDSLPAAEVKLPPVPVATRWNSWFDAVLYHSSHIHVYDGFFKSEKGQGMAVERILELVTNKQIYSEICMHLHFIKENCHRLMSCLTLLEEKKMPLACSLYNLMEDLKSYLDAGTTKTTFGAQTDQYLSKLPQNDRKKAIKSFQQIFDLAQKKLVDHLEKHQAINFYKAIRIFDPRQLLSISHEISEYTAIASLKDPSPALLEEWLIYTRYRETLPANFSLPDFWNSVKDRFPLLAAIAVEMIWMPVTSVEAERSFSNYKHILNDRRESLTQANTKYLMMLYYNGDVEGRFT